MGVKLRFKILSFLLIFTFVSVVYETSSFADEIIIIANKNVSETSLSTAEIKDIFLGEKSSWQDHTRINFVLSGNDEIHKKFLEKYVNQTPMGYKSYWRKLVFVGKGKAPKSFSSPKELVDYVAKTNGAIGYVSSEEKTAEVKIIEPR